VWANVYTTSALVRIDPESGRVTAVVDAAGLLTGDEARSAEVLNGIAHDPASDTFYLTGKHWPKLFAVRFVPRSAPGSGRSAGE
jgi:glutamine cyclotransferase